MTTNTEQQIQDKQTIEQELYIQRKAFEQQQENYMASMMENHQEEEEFDALEVQ